MYNEEYEPDETEHTDFVSDRDILEQSQLWNEAKARIEANEYPDNIPGSLARENDRAIVYVRTQADFEE